MPAPVLFLEAMSGHSDIVSAAMATETAGRFVQTLRHLRRANTKISLNTSIRLPDCEIAPRVTLQMLLSDPSHRDTWLFLKELNAKTPFSTGVEEVIRESQLSEIRTSSGQISSALLWAHVLETGTISFYGDIYWQSAWVEAACTSINPDGHLSEQEIQIRNVSDREHVGEHGDWLKSLGYEKVPSATQLWEDRSNRFTGLRFLEQVRKQFEDLATTGAPYQRALAQLKTLSDDAIKWGGYGVPIFSIKEADGEHDKRRRLSKFKDEVTGIEHEFDRHVYFTGGSPGRIHFRLSESEKKFVVGYVGFKL
jgi:hypothetical protein